MTTFQKLQNKICELFPDLIKNEHAQLIKFDHTVEYFTEYYPIQLSDVLRAIREEIEDNGHIQDELIYSKWDLTKPLADQSQSTIDWLAEVMGIK